MADRDLIIVTSTELTTFETTVLGHVANGYAVKATGQYVATDVLTYWAHMWKGAGYEVGQ